VQSVNEFLWPVRVYYEDTDAGGVVYYANYLKFMERARTEWLRALGYEQDELIRQQSVLFAVRHISVDYQRPGRFNDQLLVSARLVRCGHASITMEQSIIREHDKAVLCSGVVKIASLDARSFRPCAIPEALRRSLT
jgi:acyl-CoA thioester hydrolase